MSDQQFKPGDLVVWDAAGTTVESIVFDYDPGDDEYNLLYQEENGTWATTWLATNHLSPNESDNPLRFPGRPDTPENIFVVTAEGPEGPVIELYASPQAVENAHPEVEELRTKIMEAVADPGEKVELDGSYYLSFRSIQGAVA